jgi:hypothetical protein
MVITSRGVRGALTRPRGVGEDLATRHTHSSTLGLQTLTISADADGCTNRRTGWQTLAELADDSPNTNGHTALVRHVAVVMS